MLGYVKSAFGSTFGRWCGQIKKPARFYLRRLSGSLGLTAQGERGEGGWGEGARERADCTHVVISSSLLVKL